MVAEAVAVWYALVEVVVGAVAGAVAVAEAVAVAVWYASGGSVAGAAAEAVAVAGAVAVWYATVGAVAGAVTGAVAKAVAEAVASKTARDGGAPADDGPDVGIRTNDPGPSNATRAAERETPIGPPFLPRPVTDEQSGSDETPETPTDATEKSGCFLVTHADEGAAVLSAVADGQVHTLDGNPGLDAGDVVEATLAPVPPMAVAWEVVEVRERWRVAVERVALAPTKQAREAAAGTETGAATRIERAGEGELHVLAVPPERTDVAAADVADDEATRRRAARLGARRVEVRAKDGVVSVRYLPD